MSCKQLDDGSTMAVKDSTLSMSREDNIEFMPRSSNGRSMLPADMLWWLSLFALVSVASSHEGHNLLMNSSCTFMNVTKQDGATWHPYIKLLHLSSRCVMCTCQNGSVQCQKLMCPELRCVSRKFRQGECCEECDEHAIEITGGCIERFTGVKRASGQRWTPFSSWHNFPQCDICECQVDICECQKRMITCKPRCPRVCHKNLSRSPCCQFCSAEVKSRAKGKIPRAWRPGSVELGGDRDGKIDVNARDFFSLIV